jgi:hypothetical protein
LLPALTLRLDWRGRFGLVRRIFLGGQEGIGLAYPAQQIVKQRVSPQRVFGREILTFARIGFQV